MARIIPGLEINLYDKVPNVGGSLLFSFIVGFLNASVFPALFIFSMTPTRLKIAVITCIISFLAFIVIYLVPFGIRAHNALGIILGGSVVWGVAFFMNYLEWHRGNKIR